MDPVVIGVLVTAAGTLGAGAMKGIDYVLAKRKGVRRDSLDEMNEQLARLKTVHEEERERLQKQIDKNEVQRTEERAKCNARIDALQEEVVGQRVAVGNMAFHVEWVDRQLKRLDPSHVPFSERSGTHRPLPPEAKS